MKNEFEVGTWKECEAKLLEIQSDIESRSKRGRSIIPVLFRGQADAKWPLSTTLERRVRRAYSVSDYGRIAGNISPAIETFTGRSWNFPQYERLEELQKSSDKREEILSFMRKSDSYSFFAHLRHHGFPSPLLDWTESPYIAAYFAFADAQKCNKVAIYVFSEQPNDMKDKGGVAIDGFGPRVQTHARHFLQRSSYTICTKFDTDVGWTFGSHQEVFDRGRTDQDVLVKVAVPASERVKVLSFLDKFNLNAFSLFASEDKLLETLAFREIELSRSRK